MVKTYGMLCQEALDRLLVQEEREYALFVIRQLLSHYSGKPGAAIMAYRDEPASEELCRNMRSGVRRLLDGEPLAYILGEWEFYGLPMYVCPDVLIPRDDTVAVASLAISRGLFLGQDPRILDLCCGTGCIGLAVASRLPDAKVTLADISRDALNVAKRNVILNKMSGRVLCVSADARKPASPFLGKFDMIVSNPPYITGAEMQELPESVKEYEPHLALFGGEDGLDFYRAIVENYTAALKPGGYLCFEFGMGQGDAVCGILEEKGYTVLERTRDYNDRERAVLAQYGRKEY